MKDDLKKLIKKTSLLGNVAINIFHYYSRCHRTLEDFAWIFRNARIYKGESTLDFDAQWDARLGRGGSYDDWERYRDPTESSTEIRGDDEFMLSVIPKGSSVLEIGCGNGRLGYLLTNRNECQWVGLDISEVAIDEAKRKGLEAYVCDLNDTGDPVFNTLRDRKWDYIISMWTIQLLLKPEEIVRMLGSICNVQIHGVWNAGHWFSRLRLLFGRFPIYSPQGNKEGKIVYPGAYGAYYRHWTFNDFKQWSRDLGFEARTIGFCYKFPAKTAGLQKRMLLPSLRAGRVLWLMRKR